MKRVVIYIFFVFAFVALAKADFRVIANHNVGYGYYPQFDSRGMVITYSENENVENITASATSSELKVDNSDLRLNLYQNGVKTVLAPHGSDVNYVWASLSPDGTMILFNTRKGTAVCDLRGNEIINLGNLNAPVWYGSRYVVGMNDNNNGNYYTSSSIVIASIDGKERQQLTSPDEIGMYPTVNAQNGFIAYNTLGGQIRIMKVSRNNQLTVDDTKDIVLVDAMPPIGKSDSDPSHNGAFRKPGDVKIYINAGHGGWDTDDRNVVLAPFAPGDTLGFWESESNLVKGLMLDSLLRNLGFQTRLSRADNNVGSDRSLSAIAAEANAWGADYMLSIHSNAASGNANYVLQLYAGVNSDDEQVYPTASMRAEESRAMATLIAANLAENKITTWTTDNYLVAGDKSYAAQNLGWTDGYGVLRGLTVPGSISEGSVHDYIPEAYRLMNDGYKYLEAWYFAKSIYAYFCNQPMPTGIVAGQVRDCRNILVDAQYRQIRHSRDELLPLNGAQVTLAQNGQVVARMTTDNYQNGVFVFRDIPQGSYTLNVEYDGYYSRQADITVENNQVTYRDMMLEQVRTAQPEVLAYQPSVGINDSVDIRTPIRIDFSVDMLEDSVIKAFTITPDVQGSLRMINNRRTLLFEPAEGYQIGTEYTVSLGTEACHPDNLNPNHLAQPLNFSFRTKKRSCLSMMLNYPAGNTNGVPYTADIVMLFDQHLSAPADNTFTLVADDSQYNIDIDKSLIKLDSRAQYGLLRLNVGQYLQPNTTYSLHIDRSLSDINNITLGNSTTLTFTTAGYRQADGDAELLNGFEDVFITMSENRSHDVENYAISLDETLASEGSYCNSVAYQFANGEDEMLFLVPAYLNYLFNSQDKFVIDIYGDFSFNTLFAEFSIDGDIHQIELCTLDYIGWKTYTIPLSALPANINYQFTGIRLQRNEHLMSGQGMFCLDALQRVQGVKDDVLVNFENNVTVAPNPVDDIISVKGLTTDNCNLQLFLPDGKLIRRTSGSEMTAQGLLPGTYILRISTPEGVLLKQILKR